MEPYGIPEETIARITAVLAEFPAIERAILFGSRAKGTFNRPLKNPMKIP